MKLDSKRSVLSVLTWCKKEAYLATRLENNLSLFDKLCIQVKLNNNDIHSSFTRSEFYLSTENQFWKWCWKQAEDQSGQIVIRMFPGTFGVKWYMSLLSKWNAGLWVNKYWSKNNKEKRNKNKHISKINIRIHHQLYWLNIHLSAKWLNG